MLNNFTASLLLEFLHILMPNKNSHSHSLSCSPAPNRCKAKLLNRYWLVCTWNKFNIWCFVALLSRNASIWTGERAIRWVDWSSATPLSDIPMFRRHKASVQVLRFALAHCRIFVRFIVDSQFEFIFHIENPLCESIRDKWKKKRRNKRGGKIRHPTGDIEEWTKLYHNWSTAPFLCILLSKISAYTHEQAQTIDEMLCAIRLTEYVLRDSISSMQFPACNVHYVSVFAFHSLAIHKLWMNTHHLSGASRENIIFEFYLQMCTLRLTHSHVCLWFVAYQ